MPALLMSLDEPSKSRGVFAKILRQFGSRRTLPPWHSGEISMLNFFAREFFRPQASFADALR
jgi:hypothetical protein